ncbi:acyl-CoA dehydrogenase family protein [Streptomyces sp. NPDC055681]
MTDQSSRRGNQMPFALSEEQNELSATVRSLLARRSDSGTVRRVVETAPGYDEGLWRTLCDQVGAAGLAIPEQYGGAGFTLFETHVVLEQLGAALTPSPLLGSGVLAAQALLLSRNEAACERLLPGIAEGTRIAAVAWAGEDGRWRTDRCEVQATGGDGWTLSGSATLVLDGAAADVLLVVATVGPGQVGLFEADPADDRVRRTLTPAMDTTLRLARVEFDGVPGTPLALDAADLLGTLYDIAAVAVTALQVGAAQRGLDMTVAYSKERVQFGRPIGSFQALKHRMADMLVEVETARSASWAAAWSAAQLEPELRERAALAKAWCSESLNKVAAETVQLHGGIAITWEHDAQMVFKRAHATSQLFGQPHEHRQRLFRLLEPAAAGSV